jgi:hypothetical protein
MLRFVTQTLHGPALSSSMFSDQGQAACNTNGHGPAQFTPCRKRFVQDGEIFLHFFLFQLEFYSSCVIFLKPKAEDGGLKESYALRDPCCIRLYFTVDKMGNRTGRRKNKRGGEMERERERHIHTQSAQCLSLVGIGTPPPPLPPASVPHPRDQRRGGGGVQNTRLSARGWGPGGSQFGRLKKRPNIALCLLCG